MNQLNNISLIFTLSIGLFITSCGTTKINPPRPSNYVYTIPEKELSSIILPIRINLFEAASTINNQFPEKFYSDELFEDNGNDNLKVTVYKRQPVAISAKSNYIEIQAPMRLSGIFRIQKKVLGMNVSHEQKFDINLTAIVQSVVSIDNNWNVKLNSKTNLRWEDLPNFELAGIKVDFPKLFGQIIQGQVDKLSRQMDNEVAKSIKLRNQIESNWPNITSPFAIDKQTNSWLTIKPKQVFYSPLSGFDSVAIMRIGVYSIVEVISGYQPKQDTVPIPSILASSQLNDKVQLTLNTEITFAQINAMLAKELTGKPMKLESKDYEINIQDAQIFPDGKNFLVGLKVDGRIKKGFKKKIKGIIYLEGLPIYDPKSKSIKITNFDFNIKTKDILLKSASWLLGSVLFKKQIEEKLEFSIKDQLADAQKLATEALNKQYAKVLSLTGVVNDIAPQAVYLSAESIRIQVKTIGKVEVKVTGF